MKVFAPAKINLALHVTGQRTDGYHTLESLIAFASVGDVLTMEAAPRDSLSFSGPFGAQLANDPATNLVLKARDALRIAAGSLPCPPIALQLEKNLPLSSGIGGGSADAAATLMGLNDHWSLGFTLDQLCAIGLPLGADVPMCLYGRPLIAKGIGEEIEPVELPDFHLLLVNPGVGVSTPAIFKALATKENDGLPPILKNSGSKHGHHFPTDEPYSVVIPGSRSEARNPEVRNGEYCPDDPLDASSAENFLFPISEFRASLRDPGMTKAAESLGWIHDFLRITRNDLQPPAIAFQPVIGEAIAVLENNGALFARMSGSGATCFGIFSDDATAAVAAAEIRSDHPGWWVA